MYVPLSSSLLYESLHSDVRPSIRPFFDQLNHILHHTSVNFFVFYNYCLICNNLLAFSSFQNFLDDALCLSLVYLADVIHMSVYVSTYSFSSINIPQHSRSAMWHYWWSHCNLLHGFQFTSILQHPFTNSLESVIPFLHFIYIIEITSLSLFISFWLFLS